MKHYKFPRETPYIKYILNILNQFLNLPDSATCREDNPFYASVKKECVDYFQIDPLAFEEGLQLINTSHFNVEGKETLYYSPLIM